MFRTGLNIPPSENKINLKSKLLFIGSCFSDNIGQKFEENKFDVLSNPFGVIYNPLSLSTLLNLAISGDRIPPHLFLQNQEVWYHYLLHSDLSHTDKATLEIEIEHQLAATKAQLANLDFLVVTFGTAYIYQLTGSKETVANCHKMPSATFERRLLGVEEIVEAYETLLSLLPPKTRVALTVSPVRHVRDSLPMNSVSKSVLRLAVHQLESQNDQVTYFPAYELLLDDLRDYRFFASDMVHPSVEAIEYIAKKFYDTYLEENTLAFIKKWQNILQALRHKPFHPNTSSHQKFLQNTLRKLESITEIDVSREMEEVRSRIES